METAYQQSHHDYRLFFFNSTLTKVFLLIVFITSAKGVMFSPALICLFACQLSALYKNYSTTFLTTSVERWQTDHGKNR